MDYKCRNLMLPNSLSSNSSIKKKNLWNNLEQHIKEIVWKSLIQPHYLYQILKWSFGQDLLFLVIQILVHVHVK